MTASTTAPAPAPSRGAPFARAKNGAQHRDKATAPTTDAILASTTCEAHHAGVGTACWPPMRSACGPRVTAYLTTPTSKRKAS